MTLKRFNSFAYFAVRAMLFEYGALDGHLGDELYEQDVEARDQAVQAIGGERAETLFGTHPDKVDPVVGQFKHAFIGHG